jgi:NAD(P)-dependent dehydrogenase (short-subunit alcohol dehydrogenase family)
MPKSVLITGASTGIGEAIALRLADKGWRVFAGVRRDEDGERLRKESGGTIEPVMLDVTKPEQIAAAVEQLGGSLDALVNNAGIGVGGPVEFLSLDEWRRQLEVNLVGQIGVTQACLPSLRDASGARIVFIGSIGGRVAQPMMGPYTASKHAMEALAETLRHELRPFGIKTVLIEPGAIATPIWGKANESAAQLERDLPPEARERYGDELEGVKKSLGQTAKRATSPGKVAEVVERALTTSRPRARYLVGTDAKVMGSLLRVLPDSTRDALVRLAGRA